MPIPIKPTHVRWHIIGLVFLIYVLMFIDRVNISIAAKFIMPEFGITEVEFGWIFSAFVLGYALAQIPGGWLGDRYGPRRIMTWAILWWSLFTAVTALAGELFLTSIVGVVGSFAIIRILTGLGEAAAPPNGNRIVANWAAPQERAFALGLAERELIDPQGEAEAARATAALVVPWRKLFGARDLMLLTAAYCVLGYIVYFYFAWFYLYLVNERGFSMTSGGFYTMAPFLTCAVAGPCGGWLSDRLCLMYGKRVGRCRLSFCSMALTGILLLVGARVAHPVVAVVLLSLSLGVLYLSLSSFWAVTIDLTRVYAGTASGFMNMGGNLGGTLSPTLTPYIAQHYDWETALSVMGVLSLLAALCWLGIHPEEEIDFST
jgi:ACS family glucarate transporter-like MFS transporter